MRQRVSSNWIICTPLNPFCPAKFPSFSPSCWEANSYYPRGPIMGKGNSPDSKTELDIGHSNRTICRTFSQFCLLEPEHHTVRRCRTRARHSRWWCGRRNAVRKLERDRSPTKARDGCADGRTDGRQTARLHRQVCVRSCRKKAASAPSLPPTNR